MPLRAELNGEALLSYKMSINEWNQLKESESRRSLTLPCCSQRAVVKTSSLGTQFFAHYRNSEDCISKPESKEHLRLKSIVASAAEAAGWSVTTEYVGYNKSGDKWIADVFCTKGKHRVALEIQLSAQSPKELDFRHKRYFDSGVRDAWFMKDNVYANSGQSSIKEFPRFQIMNFIDDKLTPQMSYYPLSVAQFVKKLLEGGIVWKEHIDENLIYYMKSICWKCNKLLNIPIGLCDTKNSNFDNFIKTVENCSTFYEKLIKQIGGGKLESLGLTTIGPNPNVKGNAPGFPFCVKCTRCYSPQSNYHTLKSYYEWSENMGKERHHVGYSRHHRNASYELKTQD
jgi:hypothetical protein